MTHPRPTLTVRLKGQPEPLPRESGCWVVEEVSTVVVEASGGPWSAQMEGRTLPWRASLGAAGGVEVSLPYASGQVVLRLERAEQREQVRLDVRPAAHKVGAAPWAALLEDLERWLPGLTAGIEAPRLGSLALNGLDLPSAVEALLPLLPAFEASLREVLAQPRTRAVQHLVDRPLHHARRPDAATLAWISRHPREAAWLNPQADPDRVGPPPLLPLPTVDDTVDHPANRHVVWLVARIATRLEQGAAKLDALSCSKLNDTEAWRDARVRALQRAATQLRRLLRASPLAALRPQPASSDALMVLLDAPRYARTHRLGRRILKAGFQHNGEAPEVATRPSFELYELWTFLAVQRGLAEQLGPSWTWTLQHPSRLLDPSGTGAGARFVGSHPNGSALWLTFNHTFGSFLGVDANKRHTARCSLTGERRPDTTLALRTPRGATWLALDAKYRVGRTALGQAFSSAHIYKDALQWPAFGGRPAQALLLAPRADDETAPWFDATFRQAHGIGALALLPGTDLTSACEPMLEPLRDLLPDTEPLS